MSGERTLQPGTDICEVYVFGDRDRLVLSVDPGSVVFSVVYAEDCNGTRVSFDVILLPNGTRKHYLSEEQKVNGL